MCVTNFVKRTPRPAVVNVSAKPSMISQRLAGTFHLTTTAARPQQTVQNNTNNKNKHRNYVAVPVPAGYTAPEGPKSKPKRRRKPQKPGLTAKNHERHFVKHDYHDHAFDTDESDVDGEAAGRSGKPRKPVAQTFPMKLHSLLEKVEADGYSHIVSWQSHGRCFIIHNPKEFAEVVLPIYLRQGKLTSFQRQLNLYGFARLTRGKDSGAYYHELFLRGKSSLAKSMKRTKIKGTKFKAASSPDQEPDFYSMTPVMSAVHVSDESSADSDSFAQNFAMQTQSCGINPGMGFHSSNSFDPIPLRIPCPQVFHPPMEPYSNGIAVNGNAASPSVASSPATNFTWQDTGAVLMMAPSGISSGGVHAPTLVSSTSAPPPAGTHDILDDAVDELFCGNEPIPEGIGELSDLWDPATFGETNDVGLIQNDLQLGNLLESFLQQS
ncbi:MAG: hypothetical protein SGILL_008168 [Bacillariaceae sp.]